MGSRLLLDKPGGTAAQQQTDQLGANRSQTTLENVPPSKVPESTTQHSQAAIFTKSSLKHPQAEGWTNCP